VGVLLNVVCVLVALSGVDLMQFLVALFRAGRGLELPLHRRHDAADPDLPPGGEEQGPGRDGHLRLLDHDGQFVRVGRA
jgi:hypothetical protein